MHVCMCARTCGGEGELVLLKVKSAKMLQGHKRGVKGKKYINIYV